MAPRTPEKHAAEERARRAADPEKHREQDRTRRAANREAIRTADRAYYAANKDRIAAQAREFRAANRERINAEARARRAADPEHHRELKRAWTAANPDKIAEHNRVQNERRDKARDRANQRLRAHGLTQDQWDAIWASQDGKCYLCGDALVIRAREPVVEHDHACCGKGKSCSRCRRGLSCGRCNLVIGWAGDSPELLRTIAASLEAVQRR